MQLSIPRPTLPMRSLRAMLLVFVIFYLGFHAISGERGMLAWFQAKHQLDVLQQELTDVRSERSQISHRVELLSGPNIDADMLDEQARKVLGFAGQNEIVVLNSQE